MLKILPIILSRISQKFLSPIILFVILVSNQKQPSCKKRSAALEKAMVKKDVKSKVAAKKWL